MSKSRARRRTYVVVGTARDNDFCRACRRGIEESYPFWSPYWGGGHYHLWCEATPTKMPPGPAVTDPCQKCGWLKRCNEWFLCSRCYRLYLDEQVAV